MSIHRRFLLGAAVALTPVTLGIGLTGATAATDPAPVGPHQLFVGEVNGHLARADIFMACFGPIRPGQLGHPFAGQTVEVLPAPSAAETVGSTGSKANRIVLNFMLPAATPPPVSTVPPVVLTSYGATVAIPTSVELPCAGSGVAGFTPQPTSKSARSATVVVTFVGQP